MAENQKKGRNGMLLDDDFIKKAYTAELKQFKASDELIETTLEKCRAELEGGGKKRRSGFSWSRFALTVGAPVAACLLVLFILFSQPMGSKYDANYAPQASGASEMANASGNAEAPQALDKDSGSLNLIFSESLVPERTPDAGAQAVQQFGLTSKSYRSPNVLNSLDYTYALTPVSGDLPPETVEAILDAYNQAWGTRYTCDVNKVLDVSTLKVGGITAEDLSKATGFEELLGEQAYHMVPLQDENHANSLLLPVVESAESYDDPTAAPLEIVYSNAGRTWLASMYSAIPSNDDQIAFLLDREEHKRLVRETYKVKQITGYKIIDINHGYDFIILIEADGKEYAIPHLTVGSPGTLENHKVYQALDVLKALAERLKTP